MNNKRIMGDSVAGIIMACGEYATAHRAQYESNLSDDGVLGPAFFDILQGVRSLLNGELGAHDGGTLDRAIMSIARGAGYEEEP